MFGRKNDYDKALDVHEKMNRIKRNVLKDTRNGGNTEATWKLIDAQHTAEQAAIDRLKKFPREEE